MVFSFASQWPVINRLLILLLISSARGWFWKCHENKNCVRLPESDRYGFTTFESCRLVCGNLGALWPRPTIFTNITQDIDLINLKDINFTTNAEGSAKMYLQEMINYFLGIVNLQNVTCQGTHKPINVIISTESESSKLEWATDESYKLGIGNNRSMVIVHIIAPTIFGARHGLETLSQLILSVRHLNGQKCLAILRDVHIIDKPSYAHRGLLIDTARNYQKIKTIMKHIDAMAASKMNVLHWHITDSQSFPMVSPRVPNMSRFGAYSEDETYTPEAIKELVQYAKIRGVRIILELDAPAHVGSGWQWGPEANLGNLTVCTFQQPWRSYCIQPPCGQLNPFNSNVYPILKNLYQDMIDLNPDVDLFHMGGDEVFMPCWNSTEEITKYLKGTTQKDFLDLWGQFQDKALNIFDEAKSDSNTKLILWTSHLTDPQVIEGYISKDRYIIQTWVPGDSELPFELIDKGYKLIISTKDKWYLDHGFWGSTTYYDWRAVYSNLIITHANVLGGEVCMWGEYVDDSNVLTRTWPRAAAAAERLWSDPRDSSQQAENRFYAHRERLLFRGINVDAVIPQWCAQNEGECK